MIMDRIRIVYRHLSPARAALLGGAMLTVSAFLLLSHASAIREVQELGLPAAITIPPLEKRLEVLKEQVEVSQLQQAVAEGSEQEMIATFILPSRPDMDRVLGLIDVSRDHLQANGMLRGMSPVRSGTDLKIEGAEGLTAHPLTFEADMREEGLRQMLTLLHLSGLLTVGDALTDDEAHQLLQLTEEENPASISVMEHFLSTPLLRYAREPKPYEEQVLRSFASPAFEHAFTDLIRHSALSSARSLLGGDWGKLLADEHLWPLRFLTVDHLTIESRGEGWMHVAMEVRGYSRMEN